VTGTEGAPTTDGVAGLLEKNRAWAASRKAADPAFFERLCEIQRPQFLWIGCSDSRVPANEIVGLVPGEMFVHRNVANIVASGDSNGMAVVQYAVETLQIKDVIVCGHYGCGGVHAVLEGDFSAASGHLERWLAPLAQLALARSADLAAIVEGEDRWRKLCEWNVHDQVQRLLASDVFAAAGLRGAPVRVHGWIYDLRDGILRDLRAAGREAVREAARR
jgi:carbonic anhydrase